MSEVPIKPEEKTNPMEPSQRELALWDHQKVDDSQLKIVIAEVAEGRSLKDVVRTNSAITANYKEIVRALHQDPEVKKVYLMACGVQISGFIDNIIEIAEYDLNELPDFCYIKYFEKDENGVEHERRALDKLKSNLWQQNRKLRVDAYSKLIKSSCAAVNRADNSDEDSGNGITINIQQFTAEKLKEAGKTITIEANKENSNG